jgi:hypothetical protein
MAASQLRHRPREMRYESTDRLSKLLMLSPQLGHLDDGHTGDCLRGTR